MTSNRKWLGKTSAMQALQKMVRENECYTGTPELSSMELISKDALLSRHIT